MASKDFDRVLEQYHKTLDTFVRSDGEPFLAMYSHRPDATLGNPFGPVARGFENVAKTARLAASHYRDGLATGFETISKRVERDFAYTVEVERFRTKIDGRPDVTPFSLRVTTIWMPEEGTWKIVHRHADPITTPRPWDSVIQK